MRSNHVRKAFPNTLSGRLGGAVLGGLLSVKIENEHCLLRAEHLATFAAMVLAAEEEIEFLSTEKACFEVFVPRPDFHEPAANYSFPRFNRLRCQFTFRLANRPTAVIV